MPDISAMVVRPHDVPDLLWHSMDVDGRRAAVFCIFSDNQGVIWAGTSQGLYLYDGVEAHCVGGGQLAGTQVFAIVEHERTLYLGTNNGLVAFHQEDGRTDKLLTKSSFEVRCLLTDGDKLLIGSLDGLYAFDYGSKALANIGEGLPHQSVYSLLRDCRGILYAGTYKGLARLDEGTSRFYNVDAPLLNSSQSLFVNTMLEAPDRKTIYIGTGEGLYSYEPAHEKWCAMKGVESVAVKSLANDKQGNLFVGTYDGLYHLMPSSVKHYRRDTRKPNTLAGNQIWTVMSDAMDNVWIGHERGFSFASSSSYFRSIKISQLIDTGESNEFLAILRDGKGNLWLGGTNGVIVQKADGKTRWYQLGSEDDAANAFCVRSVMEDSRGTVWLSTDGGIYHYNAAADDFDVFLLSDAKGERVCNWVYAICQTGEDLWVGSYLGGVNRVALSKLLGHGGEVKADFSFEHGRELPNDHISNLVADDKGCLWVLLYGDGHLYRYDSQGEKMMRFDIVEMAGQEPTHLCIDEYGRLWCAYKGGALVFDHADVPADISFPSWIDESVLAMAKVDDDVWVSTVSSLWRIDGKSLVPSLVPMPQKGLTALWNDPQTGKIIGGWIDEIVEIDKANTNEAYNMEMIKLVLELEEGRVRNCTNLIGSTVGLSIPYGGSVSLLASTLHYSPDVVPNVEYRVVRSNGPTSQEGGWMNMPDGTSTINFAELSFGDYEIQFRVVSNTLSPTSVLLHVDVPFWLTWWAFVLYGLLVATMIVIVVWYLRRRAMRCAQEKEREEVLASVEQKLAFLSDEKHDLEIRINQLLKSSEEMMTNQRLQAITRAKPIEAESPVEKQLAAIVSIVEENISSLDLNGAFIGQRCGMSEKQLYRLLKKHLNVTPSEYIRNVRMQKATMLLEQKYFTVSEIAYMVGFSAPSYFSKCFQDHYGVAPSAYQNDATSGTINGE